MNRLRLHRRIILAKEKLVPEGVRRFFVNPLSLIFFLVAGIVVASLGQLVFVVADSGSRAPVLGILLLALGIALFGIGCNKPMSYVKDEAFKANMERPWQILKGKVSLVSAIVGFFLMLALVLRLLNGSRYSSDLWLWLAALFAFAVPLLRRLKLPKVGLDRAVLFELLLVAALMTIFLAMNVRDLVSWQYSAIGDEYAFFSEAKGILKNGISRPFDQAGVYGEQPVLNSVYQAEVMRLFGADQRGWKLSSLLSVVLSIPGFYLLGRGLGGKKLAATSTVLLASSHYLFAYAHIGYNNVNAILPTVWALAFFIYGLKKGSPLLLYISGAIAGLGFYTYYSARVILPIMILFVLAQPRCRRQMLNFWPVILGFVLAASPIFAASKTQVISHMVHQTSGWYSRVVTGPVGERVVDNLHNNLLAFNYNPDVFHFVSGSLLDPITGVLAVLGIGLALRYITLAPHKLLILWYIVAMMATGVLSPYPMVAITRMSFVIPPLMLLAGIAAIYTWNRVTASLAVANRRKAWAGVFVALALVVLTLNINRFWFESPKKSHLSQEAVAIGALRSKLCGNSIDGTIFIARETEALLKPAMDSFEPGGRLPRMFDRRDIASGKPLNAASASCIILVDPEDSDERRIAEQLSNAFPLGQLVTFSDKAQKGSVKVFSPRH